MRFQMLETCVRLRKRVFLLCLLVLTGFFCQAGQALDKTKYITVDEIRPGMEAYCLTVYKGTEIEKFDLEVLDVVRNVMTGRDAILVQGTDERFVHTGPVAGCSGSPVYIDGRLAGALAFGFFFSKDPLYGATPIEEMLRVSESSTRATQHMGTRGFLCDFSKPLDLAEIDEQIRIARLPNSNSLAGAAPLPCPLVTSGLPTQVVEQLDSFLKPYGFMAVAGISGGNIVPPAPAAGTGTTELVPGACLAVPLITGDITADVVGTVTEAVGDKVYGFGHSFLGYGAIDLPMATGHVHTVVSSMFRSFKFASADEIVGALTTDESTAIYGQIGAKAKMIPLAIRVDRYNDAETRAYDCRLANNRLWTPLVLRFALAGAVLMLGNLPPDHMIEYEMTVGIEGAEPITFENVSTSQGLLEIIKETTVPVALLMNNPFRSVDIESIEMNIHIAPKNIASHIWSVDLADSTIKAGKEVEIGVVVESFLAQKKKYEIGLTMPEELAPGKYELIVCGGYEYLKFLRKASPYRFVAQNLPGLVEALNSILQIKRDRLYCLLVLPPSGVTVEKAELPDLPATKALILKDAKRALAIQPYQRWTEKSSYTGTVILDKKVMHVKVEK
jgi:hypothetical protein